MKQIKYFFITLRPYQWTKNLVVFTALIFSGHLFLVNDVKISVLTFMLFCLVAGGVYGLNDILDRKEDINHPDKKQRPLAARHITPQFVFWGSLFVSVIGILGSYFINIQVTIILFIYFILMILYSMKLKHIVIIDLIIVALAFVLRAVAGAVAIKVAISPWLLVCAFFLALFLVLGKRRNELIILKENSVNHRKILGEYNSKLLDQMIATATATSIMSYVLYIMDSNTIAKFHTRNLIYTIPFVVWGIFRYLYLIYKKEIGGSPEKILINDKGVLLPVMLWSVLVAVILY